MKKKLSILLALLVLILTLIPVSTALAWDLEDPMVASNEDFSIGTGIDFEEGIEIHLGEQSWFGGDSYNLYQDSITNTGNLDAVLLLTYTPENIDLPHTTQPWWFFPGSASGIGTDTWYWATSPRGYNTPTRDVNYFDNYSNKFSALIGNATAVTDITAVAWTDRVLGEDLVEVGKLLGVTYRLTIKAGTEVLTPYVLHIIVKGVDSEGNFESVSQIKFSQPVTIERLDGRTTWVEVYSSTNTGW